MACHLEGKSLTRVLIVPMIGAANFPPYRGTNAAEWCTERQV